MSGLSKFLMDEVEMPLIPVVADMEDAGYRIDRATSTDLRDRLEPEVEQVLERIREPPGRQFNPASDEQVRQLLYEKLKVQVTKRTASGEPSTDKTVLKRAAAEHEVARDIVRYRKLNKILSTYATIPAAGRRGRTAPRLVQPARRRDGPVLLAQHHPDPPQGRRVPASARASSPRRGTSSSGPTSTSRSCASWPSAAATRP